MGVEAAGIYRRTQAERDHERQSWERADQAFFAAGACHVLAWTCRDLHASRSIEIVALRFVGVQHAFHAVATWEDWSFDHCGWHRVSELLSANEEFEGRAIECLVVSGDIADFCEQHRSRMPAQFWADPVPRAREYVKQFVPPWMQP